jgi:hypothetical protein
MVDATTGLVTALTVGTSIIHYTVSGIGGCSDAMASIVLTVASVVNSGTLSGSSNLCVGTTYLFASTVLGGRWSSSDPSVATVDPISGLVTSLVHGTTIISYLVNATGGCPSAAASISLQVNSLPTLQIQPIPPVCFPNTVNIASSNITLGSDSNLSFSYWIDTNTTIPLLNPTAVAFSGVYYIKGVNPVTGCSTTLPVVVSIRSADTVVIDTSICAPAFFVLGAQQFGVTGNYQVNFTNALGCDSLVFLGLTVFDNPMALINPMGDTAFCAGDSVVLLSNSGNALTFQWLLNGAPIPGALNNTFTARVGGQYQVIVSFGNSCFDTSEIQNVSVHLNPIALISQFGSVSICSGSSLQISASPIPGATFVWYRNGIPLPNQNSLNLTIDSAGQYYFKVATVSCEDFSDTLTVAVVSRPLAIIFPSGSTTFCDGGFVTLNAVQFPGASIVWLLNGIPMPGPASFSLVATQSGVFRAVITLGACSDTSGTIAVNVIRGPNASIDVIGDTSFCDGQFVLLAAPAVSGISYTWLNSGMPILGQNSRLLSVSVSGTYQVVMTNTFGCSDTSSAQITIMRPRPTAPTILISPTRDTLFSSIATGNQWYYNGIPISGATDQSLVITANGSYFSKVVGLNGCISDTSNIVTINNIGVGDEPWFGVKLYPNPTSGETWIEFNLPAVLDFGIDVTSLAGTFVRRFDFNRVHNASKFRLDLTDVSEGVYFVHVKSGSSAYFMKLIKSR